MDRKEFSQLLVDLRTKNNISRYALGLATQTPDLVLQRIEQAMHSYSMQKVFEYIAFFKSYIIIRSAKKQQIIHSEQEWIEWVANIRKEKHISMYQMSKISGVSQPTINNIETGKTTARIDTFLKIIDTLGYKVDKIC